MSEVFDGNKWIRTVRGIRGNPDTIVELPNSVDYTREAVRDNPAMRKAWEEETQTKWDDTDQATYNKFSFALGYACALADNGIVATGPRDKTER
jgi:hypothetical protein